MANQNLPEVIEHKFISLANHPVINETWVHQCIIKKPEILGLGKLIFLDHERPQYSGGRLDLLLKDDSDTRYTVEVQLGRLDESHLIRAIEYWDIERRRFPQYDHVAVVVAEDVTSRFLNVISLMNRTIPLIAIQLKGVEVAGHFSLIGTKVIDLVQLGNDEEDQRQIADRTYWEQHKPQSSIKIIDDLLELTKKIQPEATLRYTYSYASVTLGGPVRNFLLFSANRSAVGAGFKIPEDEDLTNWIDNTGLNLLRYDDRYGFYNIRIREIDLQERQDDLLKLIKKAIEHHLNG